jgi:hypothetical protein
MKAILKLLVALFFLPWLIIAAIVSVIKTIVALTLVFTWKEADRMHGETMEKITNLIKWLKGGDNE